ncbi:hypothetical protein JL721_11748 [Aureococcus anophagefferens]|nr:hypothetical protein JL721_11748 [Aureococcus anophagefferens]
MFDEIRGGTAPTPTGDAEDLFGLLDDEEASDLVDLNLALRSERGLRRTPPPMQQQRGERGERAAHRRSPSKLNPALSRSPAKPAPTRYERPTRAMISRFGAASGSGDDDYDYDDERKASPAAAFDARRCVRAVDFRPVGGVASPETTLDLPPESPVGKAKASASPAKLGQSRSARSLLWSSVESVGLDDDRGGGSFDDDDPPRLRDAPPRPKPSSARGKPKLRRASPDKPASAKAGRGIGPVPDLVVVNGSPSATKPAGRKSAGSGGRKHRDDRDEHRGPGGLFRRDGDDGPPRGDRVASADPSQRSWRSSSRATGRRAGRAAGRRAARALERRALEDDVDRHHDPEADGFTAIDEPTPCPFRIQVTQNDGRSTVLLDDPRAARAAAAARERRRGRRAGGALERDRAPGRRAAAGLRGPGRRAGVRGGARRADADGQGVGLGAAAGVARGPRRDGGGPPRAAAAVRGRGPPRVRGRQRPQSAIPSTYKHAALHGATPRAIFHGGAHFAGATPARKASAKVGAAIGAYDFSGKEELKRRLVADQAGLGGKGPLTLKRSPSDEDDLLEVASGSSFNDDDDNQLGAQMLETNLGEEFLSLFAPITH